MTGCQIFHFLINLVPLAVKIQSIVLNQFWNYSGAFVLTLMIIYATKNYLITLVAGFVAFCFFYFSYGFNDNDFQFSIMPLMRALGSAALPYLIGYLAGIAVYAAANKIKKKKPNHP